MGHPNYYLILQVNPSATKHEIKKAFRHLAKKYHPDTNMGNKEYEERIKEIINAYDVLIDSEKRYKYDKFLSQPGDIDYQNSPYEPTYSNISDVIKITKELSQNLSEIKDKINGVNVNAVFTILNHVLNPDFIFKEINTKDEKSKIEIINNIIYCYHFLPAQIIERLQIKVDLINYKNDAVKSIIKKIIFKRKVIDNIDIIYKITPKELSWLLILIIFGLIYIIVIII